MHTVNKIGLAFIKSQLREHSVIYLSEDPTDEAISTYVAEIEESLMTGRPQFEIHKTASFSGKPVLVHLTDEMINWSPVDPAKQD